MISQYTIPFLDLSSDVNCSVNDVHHSLFGLLGVYSVEPDGLFGTLLQLRDFFVYSLWILF